MRRLLSSKWIVDDAGFSLHSYIWGTLGGAAGWWSYSLGTSYLTWYLSKLLGEGAYQDNAPAPPGRNFTDVTLVLKYDWPPLAHKVVLTVARLFFNENSQQENHYILFNGYKSLIDTKNLFFCKHFCSISVFTNIADLNPDSFPSLWLARPKPIPRTSPWVEKPRLPLLCKMAISPCMSFNWWSKIKTKHVNWGRCWRK